MSGPLSIVYSTSSGPPYQAFKQESEQKSSYLSFGLKLQPHHLHSFL